MRNQSINGAVRTRYTREDFRERDQAIYRIDNMPARLDQPSVALLPQRERGRQLYQEITGLHPETNANVGTISGAAPINPHNPRSPGSMGKHSDLSVYPTNIFATETLARSGMVLRSRTVNEQKFLMELHEHTKTRNDLEAQLETKEREEALRQQEAAREVDALREQIATIEGKEKAAKTALEQETDRADTEHEKMKTEKKKAAKMKARAEKAEKDLAQEKEERKEEREKMNERAEMAEDRAKMAEAREEKANEKSGKLAKAAQAYAERADKQQRQFAFEAFAKADNIEKQAVEAYNDVEKQARETLEKAIAEAGKIKENAAPGLANLQANKRQCLEIIDHVNNGNNEGYFLTMKNLETPSSNAPAGTAHGAPGSSTSTRAEMNNQETGIVWFQNNPSINAPAGTAHGAPGSSTARAENGTTIEEVGLEAEL